MTVLAIDTATAATAVALRLDDGSTREGRDDPPPGAHPGHATRLLPIADTLLADAGLPWSAVEKIAVGVGPGTFTGLRVGIATARGLAQSLSCPLVGVSSLEALAFAADAPVLATVDARRGEIFVAAYGPGPRVIAPPRALAPERIGELQPAGMLAVGDGAIRYRDEIERAGANVPPDDSPAHLVRAAAVAALGAGRQPEEATRVAPDYLRRPDAELALGDAGAKQSAKA